MIKVVFQSDFVPDKSDFNNFKVILFFDIVILTIAKSLLNT